MDKGLIDQGLNVNFSTITIIIAGAVAGLLDRGPSRRGEPLRLMVGKVF